MQTLSKSSPVCKYLLDAVEDVTQYCSMNSHSFMNDITDRRGICRIALAVYMCIH
jgi:hypothetical protein